MVLCDCSNPKKQKVAPVNFEGVCERAPLKPVREHQLEDVSGLDVLLDHIHAGKVLLSGHVAAAGGNRPP